MNNTTTTARPHIVWLDALRFVAILMVIACHCTDPFNASPESRANPDFNFWGSAYGSMLRALLLSVLKCSYSMTDGSEINIPAIRIRLVWAIGR